MQLGHHEDFTNWFVLCAIGDNEITGSKFTAFVQRFWICVLFHAGFRSDWCNDIQRLFYAGMLPDGSRWVL